MNPKVLKILLILTLLFSVTSCILPIFLYNDIAELEEQNQELNEKLEASLNFNQSGEMPQLEDTSAYYKTEKRTIKTGSIYETYYKATIHRFFFKRACYTDNLYSGFCLIVADLGDKGIVIEKQDNVLLSADNFGIEKNDWRAVLDDITGGHNIYNDLSNNGLEVRAYIRSIKM
ncbi:MAG: hypothetical protein LBR36_09435 [Bacteroidales bacterium]|jgi:hypothetical protein|nr:hypothetical protein [Bacteroidales bacterium]